jgi:hypothetical protein
MLAEYKSNREQLMLLLLEINAINTDGIVSKRTDIASSFENNVPFNHYITDCVDYFGNYLKIYIFLIQTFSSNRISSVSNNNHQYQHHRANPTKYHHHIVFRCVSQDAHCRQSATRSAQIYVFVRVDI